MMSLEEGEKMRPRDLNDERERERELSRVTSVSVE